jgi:predicted metal-dependent HD superfamily phosphohydrolase
MEEGNRVEQCVERLGQQCRQRFEALWLRCLASGTRKSAVAPWDLLLSNYTEKHRRYHTLAHIDYCLKQFDNSKEAISEPNAVEMAIWFHDVLHSPGAPNNERNSADVYVGTARGFFAQEFVNTVRQLILVTAHGATPATWDERYMCDIDLSSFAKPWQEFLTDCEDLRGEQVDTSDADYHLANLAFMQKMLTRPRIFYTDGFCETHERPARANIQAYIDALEATPSKELRSADNALRD